MSRGFSTTWLFACIGLLQGSTCAGDEVCAKALRWQHALALLNELFGAEQLQQNIVARLQTHLARALLRFSSLSVRGVDVHLLTNPR